MELSFNEIIAKSYKKICLTTSPKTLIEHQWPEKVTPLVTISCNTYNHVHYIKTAIDSFLAQKTIFPVEILIHDDASTDGTAQLLSEYQRKYPSLIKIKLQKENQYKQGSPILHNFKVARGQFVATCDGDDYWCNPYKLHRQVEFMISNYLDICGHPSYQLDDQNVLPSLTGFQKSRDTIINFKTLLNKQGNLVPFSSMLISASAIKFLLQHVPPVRFHTGYQILCAYPKGMGILSEPMSVYRINCPGSTTEILLGNKTRAANTLIVRLRSICYMKSIFTKNYNAQFNKYISKQLVLATSLFDIKSLQNLIQYTLNQNSFVDKLNVSVYFAFYFFLHKVRRSLIRLKSFTLRSFLSRKLF